MLPSLSLPLSATSRASMFSLSEWFMPSLPSSLSHFSAFSSAPLSRMKRLPFRPLSAMLSPFPLFQKPLLFTLVSSCSQVGPKAPSCWTPLQSCCNWNMLRRLCRSSFLSEPFSSLHLSIYHFLTTSPPCTHTHTHILILIHNTGAVWKDKL